MSVGKAPLSSSIEYNHDGVTNMEDVKIAKRIRICSFLMVLFVVVAIALSIFGFTPLGGGAFVLAFICALIVVVDTLTTRRHG